MYFLKSCIAAIAGGTLCLSLMTGLGTSVCSAEVVEGMAPIVNGNVEKARYQARQDAMRTYVEHKVGVHVKSNTIVDNNAVTSDRIVTDSRGYVQIKQVISEGVQGELYLIKMDLEADDTNIELKYEDDIRKAMSAMDEVTDSRRVADVAIIRMGLDGSQVRDEEATAAMRMYLLDMNIVPTENGEVMNYMLRSAAPTMADLRRLAIANRTEANSVLTGRIRDLAVNRVQGGYVAEVGAYYIFAGLNNNLTNTFSEYFSEAGRTPEEALAKARRTAALTASQELAKSALKVMQLENRGGVHHINSVVEFYGITDRQYQGNAIREILQDMNCRIIREGFAPNGVYRLRLKLNGYATVGEFSTDFQAQAQAVGLQLSSADVSSSGAPVIAFTF